jgi:FkbM family methyltransferase
MIDHIRSIIRKAGLTSFVSPILARIEDWQLGQYGRLTQKRVSATSSEITSCHGKSFRLGPPTHFAQMMLSRHELPTLVACVNVFEPMLKGGVAWDVGGNAGFYAALLSKIAGEKGHVYAFEPVSSTYDTMCSNLNEANSENISAMNLGLSDCDGDLPISFDPASDTTSSLENTNNANCINVRVATGNTLVSSGICNSPNIIKMDIEGHELKALNGMKNVLANPECRALLCEVHFSILAAGGENHARSKAKKLLHDAGFDRITFISRSHLMATKGFLP